MRKIIFFFVLTLMNLPAQEKPGFVSLGRFSNAKDFFINPAGFIYITDINENKVYKLDTLGRVLKEIGGYGWNESAFDSPVDVYATSLNVYVTDMNNHRVQWFDKDLNFLSFIQTRNSSDEELRFGYPLSSAVNSQGDLLILDSENNRVIKFDMFGQFLLEFGGLGAGKFRIKNPLDFSLLNNITYVLDNKGTRIVVFDQFGNGLNIIQSEFHIESITTSSQSIWLNDGRNIYVLDQNNFSITKVFISQENDIQDAAVFNECLYILTPKKILKIPFE